MQSVNWAWGLSLIALTIAIHAMGVVMMAVAGLRIRARLETRSLGFRHAIPIVIGVVGTAGLLLAVLHGIEAAIWAAAYVWLGALNLPKDAILYSVDSITTRSASGLMLEPHWQMMGALESANGMLLFGISTALMLSSGMRASRVVVSFTSNPSRVISAVIRVVAISALPGRQQITKSSA